MLRIQPESFQAEDKFLIDIGAIQRRKSKNETSRAEGPTILVVDDHTIVTDTLVEILNLSGFRAVGAYDGKSGLRLAAEIRPDYLLTDVVMPHMSGVDLAIAVRTMSPETAILLFSGQAGTADLLDGARRHGYRFEMIAKPIHPEQLLAHLRRQRKT